MDESLGVLFFDILVEEARKRQKVAATWKNMVPAWRLAFFQTIDRFLKELGYGIPDKPTEEDEQIRALCDRLSDEGRRKLYRHLHALGCRI